MSLARPLVSNYGLSIQRQEEDLAVWFSLEREGRWQVYYFLNNQKKYEKNAFSGISFPPSQDKIPFTEILSLKWGTPNAFSKIRTHLSNEGPSTLLSSPATGEALSGRAVPRPCLVHPGSQRTKTRSQLFWLHSTYWSCHFTHPPNSTNTDSHHPRIIM